MQRDTAHGGRADGRPGDVRRPEPDQIGRTGMVAIPAARHAGATRSERVATPRLTEALQEGVAVVDASGRLVAANPMFRALLGTDELHDDDLSWLDLRDEHGAPLPAERHPWRRALASGRDVRGEVVHVGSPGRVRRRLRLNVLVDAAERGATDPGAPITTVTAVDITQDQGAARAISDAEDRFRLAAEASQRAAYDALIHQALHDELTGLPNRTAILERTQLALQEATTSRRPLALMVCDLDHFRLLNDSRGHDAGDAVLLETASRLQAVLDGAGVVARLDGDSFVVLAPGLPDSAHAKRLAQRLVDEMSRPMERADQVTMTISVGLAVGEPGRTAADLLRNADAALHEAKDRGRDRYAVFDPDLIDAAARRLRLEHEVREAIRTEALYLDFQPVRRLADGGVTAYEALVRWAHPKRGLIPPADFLPIAEASDLVLEIDRYVLLRSCRAAASWGDAGADGPGVSVNISSRHVGRGRLPGLVAHALRASGLDPARLVLELTETALLGMSPTAQSELDTLVMLGVGLAIDDFGTGYSSLRHLVDLPASFVKIDRSFVAGMATSPANVAVVEAVLTMCRSLGIHVVAEGIEDERQRRALAELGCAYGQGYLLGRPTSLRIA